MLPPAPTLPVTKNIINEGHLSTLQPSIEPQAASSPTMKTSYPVWAVFASTTIALLVTAIPLQIHTEEQRHESTFSSQDEVWPSLKTGTNPESSGEPAVPEQSAEASEVAVMSHKLGRDIMGDSYDKVPFSLKKKLTHQMRVQRPRLSLARNPHQQRIRIPL